MPLSLSSTPHSTGGACRFDPLWNTLIVAGLQPDNTQFVGMVSMIGVQYTDSCVCTGFASHLALPLLRQYHTSDMGEANAKDLMQDALRVPPRCRMLGLAMLSRSNALCTAPCLAQCMRCKPCRARYFGNVRLWFPRCIIAPDCCDVGALRLADCHGVHRKLCATVQRRARTGLLLS